MEELSYVLTQYFVSCVHVGFYFHCRSFSPCWPLVFLIFSQPLWISMFFFLRNSSRLFSITCSSAFSVIHVSVYIKNNAEKDKSLLLFFPSKSPISFQIKPWVAFGLPYMLIELYYIGMPVVRTDGRSLARCTVTWLPSFPGWVDYHISLAMGLRPRAALRYHPWCSAQRASRAEASLWTTHKHCTCSNSKLDSFSSWIPYTVQLYVNGRLWTREELNRWVFWAAQ